MTGVGGVITTILIGLTAVLAVAAFCVGLMLVRRSRPKPEVGSSTPQTVGELVRKRSEPLPDDVSGKDLFTPTDGRLRAVTPAAAATADAPERGPDAAADGTPAPQPAPRPAATPPGGVPVGDAPWRRAARMMGDEPGGRWETAPFPAVPGAAEAGADVPEAAGPQADGVVADAEPTAVWTLPETVAEVEPEPVSDVPSHPLSDPDLTPLMGIPIVRPASSAPAADVPVEAPVVAPVVTPAAVEPDAPAAEEPLVAPLRSPWRTDDDDVVLMVPAAAEPEPARTGTPQPVWFRVVRRDGEPVGGALVSLLDDRGHEVDATKTATDGGGELHAPHGGRFLMITSGDGYQPRAVILAVEEQPVEVALLLPRSATVSGAVRADDAVAVGARVVARQEGETVDEAAADREGHYRFDDLAEGVYVVSATGARGSAVREVTLSEGADVRLDLELAAPAS